MPSLDLSLSSKRSKVVEKKPAVHLNKCDNDKQQLEKSSRRLKSSISSENSGEVRKSRNRGENKQTPTKQSAKSRTELNPSKQSESSDILTEKVSEKPKTKSRTTVKTVAAISTDSEEVKPCQGESEKSINRSETTQSSVSSDSNETSCKGDLSEEKNKLSSPVKDCDTSTQNDISKSNNSNKDSASSVEEPCDKASKKPLAATCDNKKPKKECLSKSEAVSDSALLESQTAPDTDDNMHFMKQRLLASNNCSESNSTPPTNSLAGIDVNRSLTDQITKLNRSSEAHQHQHAEASTSSAASEPQAHSSHHYNESSVKDTFNPKNALPDNVTQAHSNSTTPTGYTAATATEVRSSSRTSDHSSTYGERPSSRFDDLKNSSSKSHSPASSPLIIDKGEPVLPYRDPELMRKNPVHSNVQNMLGQHKSSQNFPNVHNPMPSGPSSSSISTSMSSSSYPSHHMARSHVIPYPHMAGASSLAALSGLPPSLGQLDPASLALIQQQQLALHFNNPLLMRQAQASGYPSPANLTMAQLELLWQQKYPTLPVPPQWMLASKQEELLRDLFSLKERELERYERERMERERMDQERIDRLQREKERERQIERERQERERLER